MTATVTVIIPNYNGMKFLEPCFEALKAQTYRNFKILVVDNGSSDGSKEWLKAQGGLVMMEQRNAAKAKIVYDVIDMYPDFFRGFAKTDSRSLMNVTFGLPTETLEKRFAAEAEELGMGGLKGHRSVGGLRASIYNAMPLAGCEKLAEFMEAFYKMHK